MQPPLVLPYQLNLEALTCEDMDQASSAMASAVLSQQLADMPQLRSLRVFMPQCKLLAAIASALSTSTQLTTLELSCPEGYRSERVVLAGPHVSTQLQLGALQHLYLRLAGATACALDLPNSFVHLTARERLQTLSWVMTDWRSAGSTSVAQLLVDALRSMPVLTNLTIGTWCCQTAAVWQELPGRLAGLPALTRLVLQDLLTAGGSDSWTQSLASAIRQLTALRELSIGGDDDDHSEGEDLIGRVLKIDPVAAASQQLTAAIGSLPKLVHLKLHRLPYDVDLRHCCAYLARLSQLTHLHLETLRKSAAAELDTAAGESCYAVLLAGMTALRDLTLDDVNMTASDALGLSTVGLMGLTRLTALSLRCNGLRWIPSPLPVLASTARSLPLLSKVCIGGGSRASREVELEQLHFICGRIIFTMFQG
jgi:hypothetical protein